MCGSVTEAQDCVQEAFIRAWDRRRTLDTEQSPEAWVRTVAYRLAVSRWRKARQAFLPPDRSRQPDQSPPEPDITRVALARALQQLPADQRRAIVLHHLCDLSVAEIAHELGAPVGTVKARLSRGRTALAALLPTTPPRRPTMTERDPLDRLPPGPTSPSGTPTRCRPRPYASSGLSVVVAATGWVVAAALAVIRPRWRRLATQPDRHRPVQPDPATTPAAIAQRLPGPPPARRRHPRHTAHRRRARPGRSARTTWSAPATCSGNRRQDRGAAGERPARRPDFGLSEALAGTGERPC